MNGASEPSDLFISNLEIPDPDAFTAEFAPRFNGAVKLTGELGAVSLVGFGLGSRPAALLDALRVLEEENNNLDPRLYDHVHELVGDIDVLFIGMECDGAPLSWLYGPLLTKPLARKMDQSRGLDGSNCEKGLNLVKCLNPQQVYVYAMGAGTVANLSDVDSTHGTVTSYSRVKQVGGGVP